MGPDLDHRLLLAAERLGDDLLARAEQDQDGLNWKTLYAEPSADMRRPSSVGRRARENVYSGVAGIALFLMELARLSSAERFLAGASNALDWVANRARRGLPEGPGLFDGRLGITCAFLRMAEIDGDRTRAEAAVALAGTCRDRRCAPVRDDLLGGRAGMVIGLLRLHAATGEAWLRQQGERLVDELIERARPWRTGLYWDHGVEQARGLCGMSHGTSGVALAFLEGARRLGRSELRSIAEEAFAYEDASFDPDLRNWPDFRSGSAGTSGGAGSPDAPATLETSGNTSAWCHGAIGIGLCRLRAHELFPRESHALAVRRALSRALVLEPVDSPPLLSWTLCHGKGAALELAAEAHRVLGDLDAKELSEGLAEQLLSALERGELRSGYRDAGSERDPSLFLGEAGMGYALLRLADPMGTPSVLVPGASAPRACEAGADETVAGERMRAKESGTCGHLVLAKLFARTLRCADLLAPGILAGIRYRSGEPLVRAWLALEQALERATGARRISAPQRAVLEDVVALERDKWSLDVEVPSYSRLAGEERLRQRDAELALSLSDERFGRLRLVIGPHCRLRRCRWRWDPGSEPEWSGYAERPPEWHPVLLTTYAALRTIERWLAPFAAAVLSRFEVPRLVDEATEDLARTLSCGEPVSAAEVHARGIAQARQALRDGILVRVQEGSTSEA